MNNATRTLLALGTASMLGLTACGQSGNDTGGGAGADQLDVVTAFYPFQFVAEQVGGERVEVSSLTAPGAEPHDLELTPKQVASLSEADLVIYQKGFQPTVDKAVEQAKPKHVIDLASVADTIPATGDDDHDHGGEATSEHHEGETAEEHAEHAGGIDPHTWLSPANMQKFAAATAKQLTEADNENGPAYEANAKGLDQKLAALDNSFKSGLQSCQRKTFITSHAAFGYLADRYDLEQVGISGLSPDEEPSPARVAEVQKLAKQKDVTTIFYETLVSPAQAKSIAGDMGLKTDVLDPLEGITDQSRGNDYIAVQQANLEALRKANGCK